MQSKNENTSLVSVIIPTYNAERYIQRSLESALNQTYKNIEIMVIDDGSTDRTADIIKSYQDTRIIYLYQENQGQGTARNNGIRNSTGKYITFLDADDFYLPEKVARQVDFLEKSSEYVCVYCNALHFYSDSPERLLKKKLQKLPSGDVFQQLLYSSLINPNTILFRKEVLINGHMFKEGVYGRYSEEWEMYLKIASAGYKFGYIDEDLVVVEIRTDSNTQWATQWIIKKNTLEMFENLFLRMTADRRDMYKAEMILRDNKIKLAVTYLIANKQEEFVKALTEIYPSIIVKFMKIFLMIVPFYFLKSSLIKLWQLKQRRTFISIDKRIILNNKIII